MIIERLGEATPLLDEILNTLDARVEGETLTIPIPKGACNPSEEAKPSLGELLLLLRIRVEDGRFVVPTHGIQWNAHGIEVNVQQHYARLEGGKWKPPVIE